MDELLTELGWLRRLAHHLTRDESQADDLVQDAFLVAREHPPRAGAPLRPWLFRVMQNLFRMHLRGEGRRHRRQMASEAPGADGTAEEALENLEAHRALTDALERLEEPFRSTLLLRYYEGLPAAEIARRQDVPAGTVRWRLSTGRERLRAELDRRYQRREAWLASLALFAKPPEGDCMTTVTKSLLVVAALGAVVIGAFANWEHAAPPSRSYAQAGASAPQGAVTGEMQAAAAAPGPAAAPRVVQAPGPGAADDDEERPVIGIAEIGLSGDAPRRMGNCFVGVAHGEGGALSFDLVVDDRVIRKATIRNADRGLPELSDPAVERCLLEALQGATVDSPERVLLVTVYPRSARAGAERLPAPHAPADLAGLPSVGPENAKVVLVEYGDFQCPFSAKAVPVISELAARYPATLRIVFRHLPLPVHENAELAAEASLAAHAQGKFWPMHDTLFRHADKLDRPSLSGYAREIGLDVAAFDAYLDSHHFQAAVTRDIGSANQFQIQATPLVSINGRIVVGARPVEQYVSIIEQELAAIASGRPVVAAPSSPSSMTTPPAGTPPPTFGSATQAQAAYDARQFARCAELWATVAEVHSAAAGELGFYNAACCLALDGRVEKAFSMLEKAIAAGFWRADYAQMDPDLASLREQPRWPTVMAAIRAANENRQKNVGNPNLRRELLALAGDDLSSGKSMLQGGPRQVIDGTKVARMKEVITAHGWPTEDLVGNDGARAAWVLALRAEGDRPFQQLCLDKMEAAVKAGRAWARERAYLADRMAVLDNHKQTWGTQFTPAGEPSPIEDEEHLDQRRRQVGLPSMAEYRQQVQHMQQMYNQRH